MKISNEKPPVFEECVKRFGVSWDNTIFTYGDTIHVKDDLPIWKIVHEETHSIQQGGEPEKWWKRYFDDVEFRLSQEIEAYINEGKWIKTHIKDRNKRFKMIEYNARSLSSGMYGNIISYNEALKKLWK